MAPIGGVKKKKERIFGTRRIVLTRETNEDQVEVPGVNDQGDRYVSEHFV